MEMISNSINTIQDTLTEMKERDSRLSSSFSQIRSLLHELQLESMALEDAKIEEATVEDAADNICIDESALDLIDANTRPEDISELATECVKDYSRNHACKVFAAISTRNIAIEFEDSAKVDSVKIVTQVFDKMFQPLSAPKCGLEVPEYKVNDYAHHRPLLGSSNKLFEMAYHGLDFPFDPGTCSIGGLLLGYCALIQHQVLDTKPYSFHCSRFWDIVCAEDNIIYIDSYNGDAYFRQNVIHLVYNCPCNGIPQRTLLHLPFDPGSKRLTMLVYFETLVPYNFLYEEFVTEKHIPCPFWPRKDVVHKYAVAYVGHTLCLNAKHKLWVGKSRYDINNREDLTAIWPPRPLPKPPFSALILDSLDLVVHSVRIQTSPEQGCDFFFEPCFWWFFVVNSQVQVHRILIANLFHSPPLFVLFKVLPWVFSEYEWERKVQFVQHLSRLTKLASVFLFLSIAWLNGKLHWSLMLGSLATRVIIFLADSTGQILEQDKLLKHEIDLARLYLWFPFPRKLNSAPLYHCARYVLILFEERVETVVLQNEITFLVILMTCSREEWIGSDACLFEAVDIHSGIHLNLVHYIIMSDLLWWTGSLDKAHVINSDIKCSFQESKEVLESLNHPSKLVVATVFPLFVITYKICDAQTWCKLIGIVGKIEGLFISSTGTLTSSDHSLGAKELLHEEPSVAAHIEQITKVELKIYLFQFLCLFGRALAAVYSKMEQRANGFTGTISPCCFSKPFRIFLLCTDSKDSCFGELVPILELMMASHSYSQYQNNGFLLNYGKLLQRLKRRIVFTGTFQLTGFRLNQFKEGIIFELAALGIDRQWQYSNMSFPKTDMVQRVEPSLSKKNTVFDPGKMLCKVKGNILLEWYKEVNMIKRGYYGSFIEKNSTCRDVINSREEKLLLLFHILFIWQGFKVYVGGLWLEAGFINFTDGHECTLSPEETREIYFINEGSIFHNGEMVADDALRHPWNALEPSGVVNYVLIVNHEAVEFIIHRQLMKQGVTVVPSDFRISFTTILQNQIEVFVGYQVFDSNLEDKVLFDDGRNVMNIVKIENPLGRMSNYIWDPGRWPIYRIGNNLIRACYNVVFYFILVS